MDVLELLAVDGAAACGGAADDGDEAPDALLHLRERERNVISRTTGTAKRSESRELPEGHDGAVYHYHADILVGRSGLVPTGSRTSS